MSGRVFFGAVVLALLLQLALVASWPGVAGHLDLLLVVVVLYGLTGNSLGALLGGMLCGLLADAFSGEPYGLFGFADTIVGYSVARLVQRLDTQRSAALFLVFAGAAALQQGLLMLQELVIMPFPTLPPWTGIVSVILTTSLLGPMLWALRESLSRRAKLRQLRRPRLHV